MTGSAVRAALDLFHVPSRARQLRLEPLPGDVVDLLKIVAGDAETLLRACRDSERSAEHIKRAANFFIEQILFTDHLDSYRILGLSASASSTDLKRNFSLLMRWLHPDGQQKQEEALFVNRVTKAWNDLKTPDRRRDYDMRRVSQRLAWEKHQRARQKKLAHPRIAKKRAPASSKNWFLNCLSALGVKI